MKVHRSWILILMLALAMSAAAQSGSKTVAVVNGQNITEDDLNKAAAVDLQNLEMKTKSAVHGKKGNEAEIFASNLARRRVLFGGTLLQQ